MRHSKYLLLCLLSAAPQLPAAVKLPALISDHMVLQQNVPVRIWGTANAAEVVTISFHGQKVSASASQTGKWSVFLNPLKPGAPTDLTIAGENTIVVHDVLVGEVWVGSGQSNMEMSVERSKDADTEIAAAQYPKIRLFTVKRTVADSPADDVIGSWKLCDSTSVKTSSAIGYFFSRELHQKLGIPIGFIHSSWGGTPAQSWTSAQALEMEPTLKFISADWDKILTNYPAAKDRYDKALAAYTEAAAKAKADGATPPVAPRPPVGPGHPNTPSGLYNAMIAPLTPYAVGGVLWYQGEANASATHALPYRRLFRLMIEDWRQNWNQGSLPFLFVQLANYKANPYWPLLRESQADALELKDTGMAVAIDVGESNDIHPKNKQAVGHRLALAARAKVYGESIEYSGPLYRQVTRDAAGLRVWFNYVGSGLSTGGNEDLKGFTIAGKDEKFVKAVARIEGNTVVVSSPEVTDPTAVRYDWADDPSGNLMNRAGLPAGPFRTDRWVISGK